jgi:hypothetical protein
MPTGYTAPIYEGKDIAFPEFAMGCARAFGALIEMRDDPPGTPIPEEFTPSSYYRENLQKARLRLAEIEAWDDERWAAEAARSHEEAVRDITESNARREALRRRYEAMLAQALAWQPPTPDHGELASFTVSQLRESIERDCFVTEMPEPLSAAEYKAREIASAHHYIGYYEREQAGEEERARGRTEWVRALRASLEAKADGT